MVRPSVLHDRLKWDYKELYKHIDHCLQAGRLSKTVVDPRGLVGYRLISPEERKSSIDALANTFYREMRLDRGKMLETLDRLVRLVRGAVGPSRRGRGRPHRSHIPSNVGVPLGSVVVAGERQSEASVFEELRKSRVEDNDAARI